MILFDRPLRLGTRGSPLALAQARMTARALCDTHGWPDSAVAIVTVQTSGDRIQDRALAEIGGKALWTKELDRALAEGDIDFAVHSMKDVETLRPAEMRIAAMLPRADVRDKLVGADSSTRCPTIRWSAPVRRAAPRRWRGCDRTPPSRCSGAMSRHGSPSWRRAKFMRRCWRRGGWTGWGRGMSVSRFPST